MKNFQDIYENGNDSSALEQKWYAKVESTRGVLAAPSDSDFFYALEGGTIDFQQPFEESPHRSGRHRNNIIKSKKTQSWSFDTFINIDEAAIPGDPSEIDPAIRMLWTSLLGKEFIRTTGGGDPFDGLEYSSTSSPSITFSLFSVVDHFAQQARGCFVQEGAFSFPGDGQAQVSWSGDGKDALTIGIGKSTANNNTGSTVTLEAGDGRQMKVGGLVMLITTGGAEPGVDRSTDSPAGTALRVDSIAGDVVTLTDLAGSPVVLADADGTTNPVYLAYYEPKNPVAIDNPIVGLRGGFTIGGLSAQNCIRSLSVTMSNSHELVNYCAGEDSLGGPLFIPGDRFRADVELVVNMNKEMVAFYRDTEDFITKSIEADLGDTSLPFFKMILPKVQFPTPSIPVPATGSIPVTFGGGMALQTSLGAADECQPSFR